MDLTELTGSLSCSREDKLECVDTVGVLQEMAEAARDGGLSALGRLVPEDDPFFRACVAAAAEEQPRPLVKAVLTGYLLAEGGRGRAFLHRLLIVHGLLLILDGTRPQGLAYALQGWFGASFGSAYWARLRMEEGGDRPRARSLWPEFDQLAQASMPFIVRLTFELNASTLALALLGAGVEVRDRILKGITTQEKRESIRTLMQELGQAKAGDVEDAQRWICSYSQQLMDQCPEF